MTITQNELNKMFAECREELKEINIPISESIYGNVYINNRKSALGVCKKYCYGMFQIYVSKYLLECDKKLIKDVLFHELIHTIRYCNNHGRNFLYYMYLINRKLGTNIEVRNTNKEFGSQIQYKYKITCSKCGKEFYRNKLPKDRTGLKHASCGGDLIIEQLR